MRCPFEALPCLLGLRHFKCNFHRLARLKRDAFRSDLGRGGKLVTSFFLLLRWPSLMALILGTPLG